MTFAGISLLGLAAHATTYTITSDGSDGKCSLQMAVAEINGDVVHNPVCGPNGPSGNDVIKLGIDLWVSSGITLKKSMTIQSASSSFSQNIVNSGSFSSTFLVNHIATSSINITFQDLNLFGQGGESTGALDALGNGGGDTVTFLRCVVASYTTNAINGLAINFTIKDSYLHDNQGYGSGGGAVFLEGPAPCGGCALDVENSTFASNYADNGSAIRGQTVGISKIVNSTISENDASITGAIHWGNDLRLAHAGDPPLGRLDIIGSTIFDNVSSTNSAGVYIQANADSNGNPTTTYPVVNINGSIIGDNFSYGSPASLFDYVGKVTSLNNSLLSQPGGIVNASGSGKYTGSGNILNVATGVDYSMYDWGGIQPDNPPTHALLPGSRAIDALSSGSFVNPSVDERHFPRGFDAIAGGNTFDIGAHENDPNFEAETLYVTASNVAAANRPAVSVTGFSFGKGINFKATKVGDSVTFRVPVPKPGSHMAIRVQTTSASGTYKIEDSSFDQSLNTIVASQDMYSSTTKILNLNYNGTFYDNDDTDITFTVVGKNSKSTGYQLFLDFINLTP